MTTKKVWLQDRQTHRLMDRQTDAGKSDPYMPLCFSGDTIKPEWSILKIHKPSVVALIVKTSRQTTNKVIPICEFTKQKHKNLLLDINKSITIQVQHNKFSKAKSLSGQLGWTSSVNTHLTLSYTPKNMAPPIVIHVILGAMPENNLKSKIWL